MSEETDLRDLDAPPANPLDSIFVLPETLSSDPQIRGWYEEMVRQLRTEAQGIPMKAAQYTLMERIAYFYANMRYQEMHNSELTDRQRQSNIETWQKMLDQFNRLLEKHNDKLLNELILRVQEILKEHLSLITNPTERAALRRAYAEEFANMNL